MSAYELLLQEPVRYTRWYMQTMRGDLDAVGDMSDEFARAMVYYLGDGTSEEPTHLCAYELEGNDNVHYVVVYYGTMCQIVEGEVKEDVFDGEFEMIHITNSYFGENFHITQKTYHNPVPETEVLRKMQVVQDD